jgi:hypothetical protein
MGASIVVGAEYRRVDAGDIAAFEGGLRGQVWRGS